MASLEELGVALRNADAAGDTQAATALAGAIRGMQSEAPSAEVSTGVTLAPAMEGKSWSDVGQGAKDVLRRGGNALSFGMDDRAVAGIKSLVGGTTYADEIAAEHGKSEAAAQRLGPAGDTAAQIAGGLTGGLGMAKSGLTLAGRVGKGLIPRVLGYGAEGAAYGAAQGAGSTFSDDPSKYLNNALEGAKFGGLLGGALPVVGSAASGLYRAGKAVAGPAIDNVGRVASSLLRGASQADEAGLQALANNPAGMLPDAGPSMLGLAQGAGTGTGPGRTALATNLTNRDRATGDRLAATLETELGPAPVPSFVKADIRASQKALSPEYEALFATAKAVDTKDVANALDTLIINQRGPQQEAVRQVRGMLNLHGTDKLDPAPRTLHATREAIDGLREAAKTTGNDKVFAALGDARKLVDAELAAKVPGIKEVDAKWAELARQKSAVDRGQEIFDTGRANVVRPAELAQELAQGAQPQGLMVGPSAAPMRMKQGARAELDRVVGTNVHDLPALERTLATPSDWNYQKAGQVFGEGPRDKVAQALAENRQMRDTYQQVVQGSQTAQRSAAAQSLDAGSGKVPLDTTAMGIGARGIQMVAKALTGSTSQNAKDQIGQLLATQGPEVQAIVKALLEQAKSTGAGARAVAQFIANPAFLGAAGPVAGHR